ncbi:MAG: hypothetical protein K2P14_03790, partial [Anaeroplasmataceae bacterium]|nr:hypothetical protein [Anaeroplasmataceae bacterium]
SSILYLEKKLERNIFEAFQNPDFTVMVNIFYACASNECKIKYGNEGDLFDALLAEYGMQDLSEKYLSQIVEKSGLVQKQQEIPTPSGENKEKTWNK